MNSSSILLVDIGNTSTHLALARGGRFMDVRRVPSRAQTRAAVRALLRACKRRHGIDGAVLCSVVPRLGGIWSDELEKVSGGKVLPLNHKLKLGIQINYPNPASIGADRLANAAGAHEKYGAPVIVMDFGTALTFDIVSSGGFYEGGIILPGPMLFAGYLAEKTALLPRLPFPSVRGAMSAKGKPPLIGKNTKQAMLAGLRYGCLGMVREIAASLKREKGLRGARLCATGGYAAIVLVGSGLGIAIDPFLTLRGLERIYRLNFPAKSAPPAAGIPPSGKLS
ncbi:MAG: type III pantothenate kinase [Kiritimatiellae bacterium]|nr:type III pantothenate kinase [Kiritimatiellia bacterium]